MVSYISADNEWSTPTCLRLKLGLPTTTKYKNGLIRFRSFPSHPPFGFSSRLRRETRLQRCFTVATLGTPQGCPRLNSVMVLHSVHRQTPAFRRCISFPYIRVWFIFYRLRIWANQWPESFPFSHALSLGKRRAATVAVCYEPCGWVSNHYNGSI